jgi:hypothetical protein
MAGATSFSILDNWSIVIKWYHLIASAAGCYYRLAFLPSVSCAAVSAGASHVQRTADGSFEIGDAILTHILISLLSILKIGFALIIVGRS